MGRERPHRFTRQRVHAALLGAALILVTPVIAGAAERVVLAEHFTNIY